MNDGDRFSVSTLGLSNSHLNVVPPRARHVEPITALSPGERSPPFTRWVIPSVVVPPAGERARPQG
jgi:hypothetical protein